MPGELAGPAFLSIILLVATCIALALAVPVLVPVPVPSVPMSRETAPPWNV